MRAFYTAPLVLLIVCAAAAPARAQEDSRWEIAIGSGWTSGWSLGRTQALARQPNGTPLVLFETETALDASPPLVADLGVRLSRSIQVDAGFSYRPADLTTTIRSDADIAATQVARERVTQLSIEAGLLVHFERWRIGARVTPYASGGGAYLRELHESRTLIETGQAYRIGGGFSVPVRTRRSGMKTVGVRAEVRAEWRRGGLALDDDLHVVPAVRAMMYARF